VDAQVQWKTTRGELAATLAQVGETQDCIDQIALGGKLERIDAGLAERAAKIGLMLFGNGSETFSEAAVVGVDKHLFAGFRILHDQQAQIRQGRI